MIGKYILMNLFEEMSENRKLLRIIHLILYIEINVNDHHIIGLD